MTELLPPRTGLLRATDPAPDAVFGGKAAALRALERDGLPIPAWFVVPPDCCSTAGPDQALSERLIAAARELVGADGLLAVRSSAVDEDGARHSFAGQLDSVLAVPPEAVPAAVARVWASAASERIRAYRAEHGLGGARAPAVLVQRQLDPEAAGVAFSADPVSGRWGRAVVSAVPGCGTALVSGEAAADSWAVDRGGAVVERTLEAKTLRHRLDSAGADGVRAEAIDPPSTAPCLDDAQIVAAAALARRCAALRGAPQDIEFAWAEGRLWLLQARPITTLGSMPDPDGQLALWDNSNIAESYGGITAPLTFSFARRVYEHVYRQFCRLVGVPPAVIAANDQVFRAMLGSVRGRVYYNLLSWYRVLAMLPGFQLNRGFMEQMMGVREGLPEALAASIAPRAGRAARLRDGLRLGRSLLGLGRNLLTLRRQIRRFYRRLDRALAAPVIPLEQQRLDELVASYRELERRLLTRWDAPLTNDFFAMIFYGLLRALCRRWLHDAAGTLQNDLVGGDGTVISAQPAMRVRELAELARAEADFVSVLATGSLDQLAPAIRARPVFEAAYRAYLARFGDRCLEELKLESLTLEDDPLPLLRTVAAYARREPCGVEGHAARARAAAEGQVRERLGANPFKRLAFAWILAQARARVRDRENLRFERTRLFGRVRRIVLEMGRRLAAARVLDDPRDVFELELDELLGWVDGTCCCDDLRGLVVARRACFAAYAAGPEPAERFRTTGAVQLGNTFQAEPTATVDEPLGQDQRSGTGACPGRVRGPAVVVRDPRGVALPAGSILVAERTDPGWIMLFPAAAGLVVERGSLLSHSAIVARELGLPAVVGVPGVTTWLRDGELIELDGASGLVRRIGSEDAP